MDGPSDAELRAALAQYDRALVLRAKGTPSAKDLVELDGWVRGELREQGAPLTSHQLGRLIEWKLARGKYRPNLKKFAVGNPSEFVREVTVEAEELVGVGQYSSALKEVTKLKGIGPAGGTAILQLFNPKKVAYFSDEAMEVVLPKITNIKYTEAGYDEFRAAMEMWKDRGEWESMEDLEKAMYAYSVLKRFPRVDEPAPPPSPERIRLGGTSVAVRKPKRIAPVESDEDADQPEAGPSRKRAPRSQAGPSIPGVRTRLELKLREAQMPKE